MADKMPDTRKGEASLGVAKAVVSIVPVLGGPAAELIDVVIRPKVEERKTEWLNNLAMRLEALAERVESFTIESLADDPVFTSAMLQASTIAIRNHDEEKLDALRNAVLNVAVHSTPEEDEIALFIAFIDTFTPWHLRILAFLADKEGIAKGETGPHSRLGAWAQSLPFLSTSTQNSWIAAAFMTSWYPT